MANREYYDLIIIGGGPAGLSAGIYALRASMRTVLIEKASPGGLPRKLNIPGEDEKYARQIVISASDGCTAALAAAHYVETIRSGLTKM